MPSFGKIVDIIFLHRNCTGVFVCEKYHTDCFNHHYHSYEVIPMKDIVIIKQCDLFDYHVVHQYQIHHDKLFVPLKYHILEVL